MELNVFSPMELDAIGEIMNISLGSSATAVSNMLDERVDITTPIASTVKVEDFELGEVDPAIGVEIRYVEGIEGSNLMMLKRDDVRVIVNILMGSDIPDEEFVLDDLSISAVCEVMNQMMGAASTALSDFLEKTVNISTPKSFMLDDLAAFKKEYLNFESDVIVAVRFKLSIEGKLESEFFNVMPLSLAQELLKGFGLGDELSAQPAQTQPAQTTPAQEQGGATLSQDAIEKMMAQSSGASTESASAPAPQSGASMSQEEIEKMMGTGAPAQSAPQASAPPAQSGASMSQEEIEKMMGTGAPAQSAPPPQAPLSAPAAPTGAFSADQMSQMMNQMMQMQAMQMQMQMQPGTMQNMATYHQDPKLINAQAPELQSLKADTQLNESQAQNLDLIMGVPLEVSVEIGRTLRKVEDILTFSKGSLIVLDKLAGEQVDLFVNGMCVAKCDVVVIDDNFGVRITEVLKTPSLVDGTLKLEK